MGPVQAKTKGDLKIKPMVCTVKQKALNKQYNQESRKLKLSYHLSMTSPEIQRVLAEDGWFKSEKNETF